MDPSIKDFSVCVHPSHHVIMIVCPLVNGVTPHHILVKVSDKELIYNSTFLIVHPRETHLGSCGGGGGTELSLSDPIRFIGWELCTLRY